MKIDKFLLSIIAFIFLLSLAAFGQFRNFQKSLSKIDLSKFEIPKFEIALPSPEEETREFIDEHGELRFEYSTEWIEWNKTILETLNKEMLKEEAEILLYAQKTKLEKSAFAFLVVQKLSFKTDKNLEELIEKIEKESKEKGVETEIINLKIEDKEAIREIIVYQKESGLIFHSKEKIILNQNKGWIITVFTLQNNWAEFEKEFEKILQSVQTIKIEAQSLQNIDLVFLLDKTLKMR